MGLGRGRTCPPERWLAWPGAPRSWCSTISRIPGATDGTGTAQALGHLADVAGVRLVASVRGDEEPGDVTWRILDELRPLDSAAARTMFLDVTQGRHQDDPDLDALLAAIGQVPLAIRLMARRIAHAESAGELLALWREKRTEVAKVGAGGQKDLDLAASIELSLDPRLGLATSSQGLFAMMGRLPDGLGMLDVKDLLAGNSFEAVSASAASVSYSSTVVACECSPRCASMRQGNGCTLTTRRGSSRISWCWATPCHREIEPAVEPERAERARRELPAIDAMLDRELGATRRSRPAGRPRQATSPRHPVVQDRGCAPTARRPRARDAQL